METERIEVVLGDEGREAIYLARDEIKKGRLVAFATETVYGIAALARPEVIDRLNHAKGRGEDKHYTLHIADPQDIVRYVPRLDRRARKLIGQAWPGPVTIVFQLSSDGILALRDRVGPEAFEVLCEDGSLGVRCPDHPVARDLLAGVDAPVVAPSANVSGQPPATTGREAYERLAGRVDLVLDSDGWAGCQYGASSTVVRLSEAGYAILREGVVPADQIHQMCTLSVLFVCTGNTCRSPMAEVFCRRRISEKLNCDVDAVVGLGYKVGSAGVAAFAGQPASPPAVEACQESGLDLRRHRSTLADRHLLDAADVVLVLADEHRRRILEAYPYLAAKVQLLDERGDIPDPIGQNVDVYRSCLKRIQQAVNKRIDEMME